MTAIGASLRRFIALHRNRSDSKLRGAEKLRQPCRLRACAIKGQAMAEFLLVAPLFFFLIFAVFDYAHLFFVQMEVENAVQEAGRFASTGNHLPDPNNPGQYLSRVNSIIATLQQAAFGTQIASTQISSLLGGKGSAGGPGDTVTVSVTVNLKLMTPIIARGFPNGMYTFTSSTSFKNEPFPPGNTK
jgi:Flp pilus assembly protein TadG